MRPQRPAAHRSESVLPLDQRRPVVERRRRAGTPCRRSARSAGARRRSSVSCACQSKGTTASITPVRPPSTKTRGSRAGTSSAPSKRSRPRQSVAIQAKTWIAGRDRDRHARRGEAGVADRCGMPVVNMWCAHSPKLSTPTPSSAPHDPAVADERRARHRREDHRDHARRGQEDDVDLGMAEEPEQVLPEHRIAALRGDEERPVEARARARAAACRGSPAGSRRRSWRRPPASPRRRPASRRASCPGARVRRMPTMSSIAPAIAEISMKPMPSSHQSAPVAGRVLVAR